MRRTFNFAPLCEAGMLIFVNALRGLDGWLFIRLQAR
jgi:hypothetical protein